ncbi:MAG: TRAP transporter small permease [Haloferacaceae archaeon]
MSQSSTAAGVVRRGAHALNENAERYLVYVAYTYLMFVVVAEVLRRFLLDFSSLWGNATAQYMFIYLTYVGMSWAAKKRTHIRIDVVYSYVSDRVEDYLYLFSDAMMLLFAVVAIRFTVPIIQTSIRYNSQTQALRLNRAFFQFAVLLGFGMFAIRVLQRTYDDVADIRAGRRVFKGEAIFLEEE